MKKAFFSMMVLALITACMAASAGSPNIPITGTNAPASLQDLVGTPTLVTVVLKGSGARDPNLKLSEIREDRLIMTASNGDTIPYMADSIEQIEVQGGVVEQRRLPQLDAQMLRPEHQRVVDRAWSRVREIYNDSADNQGLKIRRPRCCPFNDADAHNYLRQLRNPMTLKPSHRFGRLYLIGDAVSRA